MKKINFILIVVVLILGLNLVGLGYTYFLNVKNSPDQVTVAVLSQPKYTHISFNNDRFINLEVADTPAKQILGLSFRNGLAPDKALLFAFAREDYWGIWMKDMLFPIDVIWLDSNFHVVHIEQNVKPDSYPTVFQPEKPAKYVVEANVGFVAQNNIEVGNQLEVK